MPADVQARLVERIIAQAEVFLEAAGRERAIETIFIGGGTPSCLPHRLTQKLFHAFSDRAAIEWTVEANPETLDQAFVETCVEAGVTRLSVGIQTLHEAQLRFLRRRATVEDCMHALELLDRHWTGALNLDFIAGIPGQTTEDVKGDLSILDGARPTHVSLYQLTLEPGTPLTRLVESKQITLNPTEMDEELWFAGQESLFSRGYEHYEVSNFCKPGKECRHNLRYWRIDPYVGAGPAAVSTIPAVWARRLPDLRVRIPEDATVVRIAHAKSIDTYLAADVPFWGASIECVSPRDFLFETLMMGLRLTRGIAIDDLESRFGASFATLFPGLWERWLEQGLALQVTDRLRLSSEGILLLDRLLGQVMDRLDDPRLDQLRVEWPSSESEQIHP